MTPDDFDKLASKFTDVRPKSKPGRAQIDLYTSAAEIRAQAMSQVVDVNPTARGSKKLTDKERLAIAEEWIVRGVAAARKQGRLMTDQQLADWRVGRRLVIGDRARYIGLTREELTAAGLLVPRKTKQTGTIIFIEEDMHGREKSRIITFHPDAPELPVVLKRTAEEQEPQYVDLIVREQTADWLDLERVTT